MTTGEKIRDLRTKANLSQEEFGGRVGVSRQTVTKWETDEGMPDADHLKHHLHHYLIFQLMIY